MIVEEGDIISFNMKDKVYVGKVYAMSLTTHWKDKTRMAEIEIVDIQERNLTLNYRET